MKINLPITAQEHQLSDDTTLITTTDLKGRITSANAEFVAISGYSEEELIGASHNIVRHPHMPPAAFDNLWQTIKSGKPWNGLVKNRCKNGDYYWVDAFVAPIMQNGEVVGYQSVRTRPSAECVARAEALYEQMRNGKVPTTLTRPLLYRHRLVIALTSLVLLPLVVLLALGAVTASQALLAALVTLPLLTGMHWWLYRPIAQQWRAGKTLVDNPLMDYLYTGRSDEFGTIGNGVTMLSAKLRTVLGRIGQYSSALQQAATETNAAVEKTSAAVIEQQRELVTVAATMHELNAAAHEVAANVVRTADASRGASELAQQGAERITNAIGVIDALAEKVRFASAEMKRLDQYSDEIGTVLDVIRSIAEQTNLLALNAAIEAARAGEQGRGFAVVADEVRVLASRTRSSTSDIQLMIQRLQDGARSAVAAIAESEEFASRSEGEIEVTAEAIGAISGEVRTISAENQQVASAAEEQTCALEEVDNNIANISAAAEETARTSEHLKEISQSFSTMACQLRVLVAQCRL